MESKIREFLFLFLFLGLKFFFCQIDEKRDFWGNWKPGIYRESFCFNCWREMK
ncbi:hypothetical protein ACB098_03G168900 [Castanea mollissima]